MVWDRTFFGDALNVRGNLQTRIRHIHADDIQLKTFLEIVVLERLDSMSGLQNLFGTVDPLF